MIYEKGEVVWAKIKGYPWWPAVIGIANEDKDSNQILVNFIGENSHSYLKYKYVCKYTKNYKEYSSQFKNKKFIESLEIAQKIINKESTYDIEKNKLY